MKKIFNNRLFIFILGVILSGTVVYAGTMLARDIDYDNTSSNLNATNVQDAIDELFGKANEKIIINTFGTAITSIKMSDASDDNTTSLTLDEGKYLIDVIQGNGYVAGNNDRSSGTNDVATIICENNCSNLTRLNNYDFVSAATNKNEVGYSKSKTITSLYYVEIDADNTTISSTYVYPGTVTKKQVATHVLLIAIPIN